MTTDPTELDALRSIESDETPQRLNLLQRILQWLRAGYPQGVPREDYVALLGVLHRQLNDAEVETIASRLRTAGGDAPIDDAAIHAAIRKHTLEKASPEDIARVSARLAAGGWPLAAVATPDPPAPEAVAPEAPTPDATDTQA